LGAQIDFWKVAIRPGKPLIVGRIGKTIIVGLPGNPSSAYVTATLFLLPLARHLAGCADPLPKYINGTLAQATAAGGKRVEFYRAFEENGVVSIFSRQDSGMLTPLSKANALLVNPIDAPVRQAGEPAQFLRID
jgi:molybdopterin molybdotransferase